MLGRSCCYLYARTETTFATFVRRTRPCPSHTITTQTNALSPGVHPRHYQHPSLMHGTLAPLPCPVQYHTVPSHPHRHIYSTDILSTVVTCHCTVNLSHFSLHNYSASRTFPTISFIHNSAPLLEKDGLFIENVLIVRSSCVEST